MNLVEARETTIGIIQESGLILRKHFELRDTTDRSKGGVDFVTEADEEVDRFLVDRLGAAFPNTNFLTEETAPNDYSGLAKTDNLWVIDPLDGTTLFSRGNPNFGISIGLVDKGIPKLGVVYLPMTDRLLWAQSDQDGAFLNGKRIHVSTVSELRKTVVITDWPHDLTKRIITVDWQRDLNTKVRSIQIMGSAVAALSFLACGETDAFLHPGIKPWDVAAGALLVEKAGGKVTKPDVNNWNIFDSKILASNSLMHEQISQIVSRGKF